MFFFDSFSTSDKDINFYTGFPNKAMFDSVFNFLDPGDHGENIVYWHSSSNETRESPSYDIASPKQGRPRKVAPRDETFLTLCSLRQGFSEEHLGHVYGISQPTVSRIITSWLNFMYLKFSRVPIWPSRATVDEHMPTDFKENTPLPESSSAVLRYGARCQRVCN